MEKVLFVDDEPKILEAYRRTLRKDFKVVSAEGGSEGLQILEAEGPFPVIVSDMNMPEMNGVQFLSEVKKRYPQSVRIMLTGNADQKTASEAINVGDVYRFLNKPCPPDKMTEAINDALGYYYVQNAEKDMLENTVRGSISALSEILSMAQPKIFGRVNRLKTLASRCATQLGLDNVWEIESIASLSQIGIVSLPDALQQKVINGDVLSDQERELVAAHPQVAASLVGKIAKLESVAEAIRWQQAEFNQSIAPEAPTGTDIPIGARVIKVLNDYLCFYAQVKDMGAARAMLLGNEDAYDADVLAAVETLLEDDAKGVATNINVSQIKAGMVLAQDVLTVSGALLIENGFEVSETMATRLINFWRNGEISEQLAVYVREEDDDDACAA